MFSFATVVFSPRLPVKTRLEISIGNTGSQVRTRNLWLYICAVSTAVQHAHRIGTSLAASWSGVPVSKSPCHCKATQRSLFHTPYDVPRKGSYPLRAGPFRLRSHAPVTSPPLCQFRQRTWSLLLTLLICDSFLLSVLARYCSRLQLCRSFAPPNSDNNFHASVVTPNTRG